MTELLATKSIDDVTVNDVLETTGLSRRSFYNHFKNKYDLAARVWKRFHESCWYGSDGSPCSFREFLENYHRCPDDIATFMDNANSRYRSQDSLWDTSYRVTSEAIIRLICWNGWADRIDDDVRDAVSFYTYGLRGLIWESAKAPWIKHAVNPKHLKSDQIEKLIRFIPEDIKPYMLTKRSEYS